jgi:hypothetical protein
MVSSAPTIAFTVLVQMWQIPYRIVSWCTLCYDHAQCLGSMRVSTIRYVSMWPYGIVRTYARSSADCVGCTWVYGHGREHWIEECCYMYWCVAVLGYLFAIEISNSSVFFVHAWLHSVFVGQCCVCYYRSRTVRSRSRRVSTIRYVTVCHGGEDWTEQRSAATGFDV